METFQSGGTAPVPHIKSIYFFAVLGLHVFSAASVFTLASQTSQTGVLVLVFKMVLGLWDVVTNYCSTNMCPDVTVRLEH